MTSKRTKACAIKPEVKKAVYERDHGRCIVCGRAGFPHCHYIGRAQGGLGIEQNIVTLCDTCHADYDNGKHRHEIHDILREYLQGKYPGWNEKKLIYNKWEFLNDSN